MSGTQLSLFGGEKKWNLSDWTASNDTVRGGKSESYLEFAKSNSCVRFFGNLDIKTLGGAGFASQRTTGEDRHWDLSGFDGIALKIKHGDSMRYMLTIKDELLPKNPENGREQSTISYEYDFLVQQSATDTDGYCIFIPWEALTPTYRGKEKPDAPPLDLKNIKRFSLLMRSFFGDQEGHFSMTVESISAVKDDSERDVFLGEKGFKEPFIRASDYVSVFITNSNLSSSEARLTQNKHPQSRGLLRKSLWAGLSLSLAIGPTAFLVWIYS